MTVYIYQFDNKRGFYAFNQKQKPNAYLTGMLLYATTKNALIDLIKERLTNAKTIKFMHWNGLNYETQAITQ